MMKYVIYHAPERKIGCTTKYPRRPINQGLTNYYIEDQVSEGCGAKFASKVEKFWQWYYGLKEDKNPYHLSIENSGFSKFTLEERRKYWDMSRSGTNLQIKNKVGIFGYTKEEKYLIGKSGADALTTEQRIFAGKARAKSTNSMRAKCEVCGFESTPGGVGLHKYWSGHSNSPVISEG